MSYYTDTFPGRQVTVAGKCYLYFGGTSYLGLQANPNFQDLYIQNIRKYGTNYGASRKSNLKLALFDKAEGQLSAMVESEACATQSSGYLAGQLVAQHFDTREYTSFYAPNSHSALYQKGTNPFKNFENLVNAIKEFKISGRTEIPVVFIDSIDSIATSYPDFKALLQLPLNEVIVVVDDSHGIGILGKNGSGAYPIIKEMAPKELVVCCSLGKGFGIQAGAIFGTKARINQLVNTDFYGGASPAAPAALATFYAGHHIYREQRKILNQNLELFLNLVQVLDRFHYIQGHPVFSFENSELADYLKAFGILITNFKYPNEAGALKSRIVISSAHIKEDIELLADLLNSYK